MATTNVSAGKPVNEKSPLGSAITFLNTRKQNSGTVVATWYGFYNTTGQTFVLHAKDSLHGHFDDDYYPTTTVENGQFGGFCHVEDDGSSSGSVGYVVYRGKYTDTKFCKQVLAWATPGGEYSSNLVYCEIFDDEVTIDPLDIYKQMELHNKRMCTVKTKGMYTIATTVDGTATPIYGAILTTDETAAAKNSKGVEA